MIRGVHTMFYSSRADELRAFLRDKLGFRATDVGERIGHVVRGLGQRERVPRTRLRNG